MKKLFLVGASMPSLAACTTTEQGAATGAVIGGTVGAVTTGSVVGTAVGAGVGAVAGTLVSKVANRPGTCYYRDAGGRMFTAACPQG